MFKMHTDMEKIKAVYPYYMNIHAKLCYRMERRVFKRMPPSMVLARRKNVRSECVKQIKTGGFKSGNMLNSNHNDVKNGETIAFLRN